MNASIRHASVSVFAMTVLALFVAPTPGSPASFEESRFSVSGTGSTAFRLTDAFDIKTLTHPLYENSETRIRLVTSWTAQSPARSSMNPGNTIFRLPDTRLVTELRPDFSTTLSRWRFSLKPRFRMHAERVMGVGTDEGYRYDSDLFINEWLIRVAVTDDLHISLGRENLQWGPAYLASPSNPFFMDNGRLTPREEIPGKEMARAIWSFSDTLSASLIAGTGDQGHDSSDTVDRTLALKLDWTGSASYASLILSHEAGDRSRLGLYGGHLLSDAVMVYLETAIQQGSEAFYPETQVSLALPGIARSRFHDDSVEGSLVAGGAYTFLDGTTLTAEYLYHSPGYTDREAEAWFSLGKSRLEPGGYDAGTREGGGAMPETGLRFLRQHYLMLQAVKTGIRDVLDLTGRWTWNLDDHSTRLYAGIGLFIGDHLELFANGTLNTGNPDTEFRQYYDHQVTVGLELCF